MSRSNDNDWLDDVLRAPHVDDDGFAARVVHALPPPAEERSRAILFPFFLAAIAIGLVTVLDLAPRVDVAIAITSWSGKLMALCTAAFAVVAAALSGESLKLKRLQLSPADAAALLPAHPEGTLERTTATSAAQIPTVNLAHKKPVQLIEKTEDLDEETAWEVVRATRKHRPLFGTVWFFFLAAPFILIAMDNIGVGGPGWLGIVMDVVVTMIVSGFFLGTPIVWWASRRAFFKECEQLGISRSLARRLRLRLSVANALPSPVEERDARAVARLRQMPWPKKAKKKAPSSTSSG